MAEITIDVTVKTTEAFQVLMSMKDDISDLFDMVPDYLPEKVEIEQSILKKWRRMAELVELGE